MKRSGILNRHLAGATAALGHTDLVLVCDAGMPIPPGPTLVDLAFLPGVPTFQQILEGLLAELVIEGATAATEIRTANPTTSALLDAHFPALELISHEELKLRTHAAHLIVRTGETHPYANVLLRCGVAF